MSVVLKNVTILAKNMIFQQKCTTTKLIFTKKMRPNLILLLPNVVTVEIWEQQTYYAY